MFFISRDRTQCVSIGASRLFAVALTVVTLAACTQHSVVTDKSASLATSRQTPPSSNRTAAIAAPKIATPKIVASKHEAVAAKKKPVPPASSKPAAETTDAKDASYGLASYYWQGTKTASGEKFNTRELTAAHRTLPFGTRVRVTDLATGRAVTVRINDRGPFVAGRIVDVSQAAAESLGMVDRGVAKIKLDVVQ
jgi:rare lipoprotein A